MCSENMKYKTYDYHSKCRVYASYLLNLPVAVYSEMVQTDNLHDRKNILAFFTEGVYNLYIKYRFNVTA